jgi:hypothetical protein
MWQYGGDPDSGDSMDEIQFPIQRVDGMRGVAEP